MVYLTFQPTFDGRSPVLYIWKPIRGVVLLFGVGGNLLVAFKLCHDFVVPCLSRTNPTEWGTKLKEVVSLTLEPMIIGPISLNLICDVSGRVLHSVFKALPGVLRHHDNGIEPT